MNRRTFLAAGTAAATTLAAAGTSSAREARGGPKVLVPGSMTPEQLDELRAVAPGARIVPCEDRGRALAEVADADASYGFIDAGIIRAGKHLRWVQQPSAGVERLIEIPELVEGPVVLTNMQRVLAPEIADQAIGYLLALTRRLDHYIRVQPERSWSRPPEVVFEELLDKTMVVIGLGGIGSEVARRAYGFGMRVLATDPKVYERPLFVEELHKPEALDRLLPRADVVVSAVPLYPATRKLIGADRFARMRRGVVFLNVSRGGIVDTDALVRALESRQVAAAGLDVTDPEPLPPDHPLWGQNVIITPHTAGQSPGGQRRAFALFKENLRRFAAGEMLLNVVDKRAGY